MILTGAVGIGLIAGLIRALIQKRQYQLPEFRGWWLVFIAVIPQVLAFIIPSTRVHFSDLAVRIILVGSQVVLMVFICLNYKIPGMIIMGVGTILNLTVILLNSC